MLDSRLNVHAGKPVFAYNYSDSQDIHYQAVHATICYKKWLAYSIDTSNIQSSNNTLSSCNFQQLTK